MTEYELVELSLAALGHMGTAAMYLVSVIFAYLVAAYAAGDKLSRGTAWTLSAIYTASLIFPSYGIRAGLYRYNRSVEEYLQSYPDGMAFEGVSGGVGTTTFLLSVAPLILAWIASLIYMHGYVRRQPIAQSSD